MKRFLAVVVALLGWMAAVQTAQAQVQFGLSAGPNGVNDFYLSVGSYFNVPPQQVTVIRDHDVPDEQIPVVLFIAQRAHVDPQEVVEVREEGYSWQDVALRFGLGPDAFYVAVNNTAHSPYGRAYGYYHRYNRRQWRRIRLSDDDIVNMVNLRFVSEYSHHTPDEVVRLRGQGRSFIDINEGWRPRDNDEGEDDDNGNNGKHRGWDKEHGHHGDQGHHGDDDNSDEGDNEGMNHGDDHGGHHFHHDGDQDHHDQDHQGDDQN